ncbi:MAG TPA: pyruvate:ferredoxin (flavodoxin) oxidoreductase [Spirochaetota bacterium]|nr:pyruvate:ferredoxin (flavodoxin) oxidoreductase [Spirochaetota bacterium]HPI88286.1 pyruvate:ferredoxin (flavodoxin) oxidoreductase [Spirochaetota bacterium]HPR47750.1 pyruvate:ferredoxin (flavodoxin) oxidoreductase [Spirochaetota bacterium]
MAVKKKMISMDGNMAAAHVAYAFTEVASIYPITPSSPMAEHVDEWSAMGKKNIFGNTVRVVEMQSEAGAAAAMHGALQAGSLATTFTASQGLLLMIPNMYKISGELLPGVFHVSARALSTHALSIFGDHSDIYACRQTGFAMLASGGVQEVMDLGSVAHLAAVKCRVPFVHFFDGFRTSHEIQKIEVIDYDQLGGLLDMDMVQAFRRRALNPEFPVTRGTNQNPDIYFQMREAANMYYDSIPDIVEGYMREMTRITGREYHPFNYYGAPDAEHVVIAMGSVTETLAELVDTLTSRGEKVGIISVHLYRPFSKKYFMKVIPNTVKRIAVLDRTKEPGANGGPLYQEVREIFYNIEKNPLIVGGMYGLGSKDTTPGRLLPVFDNLKSFEPKNFFTVGIVDDVTHRSLPVQEQRFLGPKSTFAAKFYGLGSDGTVGANKNTIKIIGDNTDKYAQAYFAYDSKKSGGITISHLRFGDAPIKSTYLIHHPHFVACHVPAYIDQYDMLEGLAPNGTFLLNSMWDVEETKKRLPDRMKKYMADNNIKFYIINATQIAQDLGLGTRTNTIMQAAFFKLANVIDVDDAEKHMKSAIKKTYGLKGDNIVNMNNSAIDKGLEGLIKVNIPEEWKHLSLLDKYGRKNERPKFVREVADPINRQEGCPLPVSSFIDRPDGTFPPGTTKFEKRGVAVNVPEWQPDQCIQCNQCAFVCPHAVIRPFLLDEKEAASAPEGMVLIEAKGKGLEGMKFRIQISPLDCTGCGNCADVCPAKEKALIMKPLDSQRHEAKHWYYCDSKVSYKDDLMPKTTIKGSQFAQPLFEFSGACAGCGETPYIKLITQLFGDRMLIANATGCSSIYGASAPSTPYCTNAKGHGPAWASSLFEDAAEYGYGMLLGVKQMQSRILDLIEKVNESKAPSELKEKLNDWLVNRDNPDICRSLRHELIPLLNSTDCEDAKEILKLKQYLVKKSVWSFGGDGWAYDIGYGGIDHVLASGEDINLLVMDTEVYSNTGGQSSKATPKGAVAKFAAAGKRIKKKDLGLMAVTYGYVYVAQIAMGANQAQTLRVISEAEAYPGPSLIIAYCPCINHGLRAGMGKSQHEEKLAVECGFWHLWRYNPLLEKEGKNPFVLDSKEPQWDKFQEYLMGEVRYTSLMKAIPDKANDLYKAAQEDAQWRYNMYKRLAGLNYGDGSSEQ